MNWATITVLALITVFLIYTGVIPSISDAYRTVKDKRIYHLFFFLAAVLVGCQAIYCEQKFLIPYVVAGFQIFSISMAAEFWKKDQGRLHVIYTYSGFGLCMALTILQIWPRHHGDSLHVLGAFAVGYLIVHFFFKSNKTYWQEVWLIVCVLGPLIQKS